MTKAIEITDANFDELIKTDKPVLLDFWATWCGPCKFIGPIVDEIAADYDGQAVVGKVDVDVNPRITVKFGVRNAPTLLVLVNGVVVEKQIGAVPKAVLLQKLEPYL